ncbi:MAG: hypothetical protein HYZ15_09650 [Sphingobacteriales bacterium]|nr:hypothetical protein [Sphingobacteriales bacterium]
MKVLLMAIALVSIGLFSCKKDSPDNNNQEVNTWTFKAQGTTYKGVLFWDPLLNTLLQGNNSYTFTMLGGEANSDRTFNIVMSLADTTFTSKNYQSGISGNDDITAFYFTHGIAGNTIYESSNYYPGPVMNYTIETYNAATRVLVFTFSGNTQDANGVLIPVTEGKVTCKVEKM